MCSKGKDRADVKAKAKAKAKDLMYAVIGWFLALLIILGPGIIIVSIGVLITNLNQPEKKPPSEPRKVITLDDVEVYIGRPAKKLCERYKDSYNEITVSTGIDVNVPCSKILDDDIYAPYYVTHVSKDIWFEDKTELLSELESECPNSDYGPLCDKALRIFVDTQHKHALIEDGLEKYLID